MSYVKFAGQVLVGCFCFWLFVTVAFLAGCGGEYEPTKAVLDQPGPAGSGGEYEPECSEHEDCYPDHTFCVNGTCTGDPQPENLPNEGSDATITNGDDTSTSQDNGNANPAEGPWGNIHYNGEDAGSSPSEDAATGTEEESSTLACKSDSDCPINLWCDEFSGECSEPEYYPNVECVIDSDCDDSDIKTEDVCFVGECFSFIMPECFAGDSCDDADDCTYDECDESGVCVHWDNCNIDWSVCENDADCDDGDDCTKDECDVAGDVCLHTDGLCPASGEPDCETDSDCDDGDEVTDDICWVGECFYAEGNLPPECIGPTDDDCFDDNPCTTDECLNGSCEHTDNCIPDGSLCEEDADCDDGDDCTKDECEVATGGCSNTNQCEDLGGEAGVVLNCVSDADCVGTKFGNHCYAGHCAPCVSASDKYVACDDATKVCMWKAASTPSDSIYELQFSCVMPECGSASDCDDGDICTDDLCSFPYCYHTQIQNCVKCKSDGDCEKKIWCDNQNGGVYTKTGACSFFLDNLDGACDVEYSGKPEDAKKYNCPSPLECSDESDCPGGSCVDWQCYYENGQYPDCVKSSDCGAGQYCTANKKCQWTGDLQCKFECPESMKYAVVWYGSDQSAVVQCGAGVFSVAPATLCLWGTDAPTFKFNLWNGGDVWAEGDKAVLLCNDEAIKVTPDPKLGSAGVQVVSLTDVSCQDL